MKKHHFTEEFYINPNGTVWFHSSCKLWSAARPSTSSKETTCLRCKTAISKKLKKSGGK